METFTERDGVTTVTVEVARSSVWQKAPAGSHTTPAPHALEHKLSVNVYSQTTSNGQVACVLAGTAVAVGPEPALGVW